MRVLFFHFIFISHISQLRIWNGSVFSMAEYSLVKLIEFYTFLRFLLFSVSSVWNLYVGNILQGMYWSDDAEIGVPSTYIGNGEKTGQLRHEQLYIYTFKCEKYFHESFNHSRIYVKCLHSGERTRTKRRQQQKKTRNCFQILVFMDAQK